MEDVKCIEEAYETHDGTGRWRFVIQIVSGKQIVCKQILWGVIIGKNTILPISAVEGCVCIATGVRLGCSGGCVHSYGCVLGVLRCMCAQLWVCAGGVEVGRCIALGVCWGCSGGCVHSYGCALGMLRWVGA